MRLRGASLHPRRQRIERTARPDLVLGGRHIVESAPWSSAETRERFDETRNTGSNGIAPWKTDRKIEPEEEAIATGRRG